MCGWAFFFVAGLRAEAPLWPLSGDRPLEVAGLEARLQPTASGEPSSALFGCVRNNGGRFHEGLDLAPVLPRQGGEPVDPVLAIHEGRVVHLSPDPGKSSYGRYVVIEHEHLRPAFYSLYAHLSDISPRLQVGDWIAAGTSVGTMGRSAAGYVIPRERAHLHFEVGLRLTDQFQSWYDRQDFGSPNEHGNYNGMNLVGLDPVAYLFFDQSDAGMSPFETITPALLLQVRSNRRPSLLRRSPAMQLPADQAGPVVGWEITVSAWGLPLTFKPLTAAAIDPDLKEGAVRVLAYDATLLEQYACREIVRMNSGRVLLGSGGQALMSLLFEGAEAF